MQRTMADLDVESENLDEPLSLQIVKNLFYVGKCFSAMEFRPDAAAVEDEDGDEVRDKLWTRGPCAARPF